MKAKGSGLIIRSARVARNMSQLDLAVASGLSLGCVSIAERSGRLSPRTAELFAAALGLPVRALRPKRANGLALPSKTNARAANAGV